MSHTSIIYYLKIPGMFRQQMALDMLLVVDAKSIKLN